MKSINEAFSSEESKEIYDKFITIVSTRRDNLVKKYGKEAERVAYASAVNQVKKKAANKIEEPTTEEPMDQEQKLKEMIQAALSKPLSEKKAKPDFLDIDKDGDKIESMKKASQDKKKMQTEDLDLGHEDNEPHMIKAELAHIAKYAMELYRMVDQFEGPQEVDFPGWWQSKITTARNMISSAKHYLEFELEEPKLDALAGVTDQEDMIDEKMSKKQVKKRGKIYDALKDQGMSDEKAGRIATSKAQKIKEAVLAKLKESKGEYSQIEKQIADLKSKGKNAGDKEMQKLIKRRAELEKSKK
jgi:hypothetical protein